MPTFATSGPITATVEVAGARVRVTASDRTDTVRIGEVAGSARIAGSGGWAWIGHAETSVASTS
jgi:hypothetical protein